MIKVDFVCCGVVLAQVLHGSAENVLTFHHRILGISKPFNPMVVSHTVLEDGMAL